MKRFLFAAAVVVAGMTTPGFAADVGVSVSIGQPGFYGQLDIGGYPPPQVIYRQPILIERGVERPPIYLRVPPGHARHWRKHCGEYNACDERVYFVNNNWYNRDYAPRYQEQHREHRQDRRENRREERGDHDRGQQNDRHHDNEQDNDRDHH